MTFRKGMWHGLPIALGYLSVSFGFGIMAVRAGLSIADAVLISLTNLTSAGQVAGVSIIAAAGGYWEMALTQLVINIRYALMGISLSQKLDGSFTVPKRMLTSFGITDEVFAMASAQPEKISARYLTGMILSAVLGWNGGTLLGAAAGAILPDSVTNALGIVLYGMFLAILVPPAREKVSVLAVILIAAGCSVFFKYVLPMVGSGFAVIICAIVASVIGALLFPVPEESEVKAS